MGVSSRESLISVWSGLPGRGAAKSACSSSSTPRNVDRCFARQSSYSSACLFPWAGHAEVLAGCLPSRPVVLGRGLLDGEGGR